MAMLYMLSKLSFLSRLDAPQVNKKNHSFEEFIITFVNVLKARYIMHSQITAKSPR